MSPLLLSWREIVKKWRHRDSQAWSSWAAGRWRCPPSSRQPCFSSFWTTPLMTHVDALVNELDVAFDADLNPDRFQRVDVHLDLLHEVGSSRPSACQGRLQSGGRPSPCRWCWPLSPHQDTMPLHVQHSSSFANSHADLVRVS